ncbi:MAG: Tol-Pal system beta propeller repeat protein TolB [Coxiella-like endosymbiont]
MVKHRGFVSLIIFLFFLPAYGTLDLELTQGIVAAIPIAVVPFAGPRILVPGNQTVTEVIKNDLQNSGQFRVIGPPINDLDQIPESLQDNYWHTQKVSAIMGGAIHPLGLNRYRVAFTLMNVFGSDNVLLSDSFSINSKEMRNLAHHISDLIYQKLTGVRGIFSTKVAYILLQRSLSKADKYTLEVMDVDGFNPKPVLVSDMPIMSPSWSPDGQKIAYVSFEGHRSSIYLQDLMTGVRQRISDSPGINGAPAFSPDGSRLALVLSKMGNPNVYILSLDSGQLQEITQDWSINTEPAWSADGKSLLFTSNRDGTPQIYEYSLQHGTVTRLTYRGDYNAKASFLQDGQSIIMMHRDYGLFGIARQNLITGYMQILTKGGSDESPSVAPNGKMIIYSTEYNDRGVLAQVSVDGQIKLRLPSRDGIVQEPAWSPFLNF